MHRLTRLAPTLAISLSALLAPATALGASRLYINGRGNGHGIGMSQYGAYGLAKHGWGAQDILKLYYRSTALETVDPDRTVNVLLETTGRATFSGAKQAGGRALDAGKTYSAQATGSGRVSLYSASGRRLAVLDGPLTVGGGAAVKLGGTALNGVGAGRYRGALALRPSGGGGLQVLNVVGVDDYVRGVISGEMPSSWAPAALRVQAVAARTYGITAGGGGTGYLYPDTRSQVYRGVAAETADTDAAVSATRGVVVTYAGKPAITYFFSTSGGRTENIEDSFIGAHPEPWLVSVRDPYDAISPRHKWGPYAMSLASAGAKLGGLVKGSFRRIVVSKRGHSPRIVRAYVVGTRGRTRVTGAQLRARFGLFDTWAYFTRVSAHRSSTKSKKSKRTAPTPGKSGGAGGPNLFAALWPAPRYAISGSVQPAHSGTAYVLQRRSGSHWSAVGSGRLGRGGVYRAAVSTPGTYRVVVHSMASPAVPVG